MSLEHPGGQKIGTCSKKKVSLLKKTTGTMKETKAETV